jgi:hypothetical protein
VTWIKRGRATPTALACAFAGAGFTWNIPCFAAPGVTLPVGCGSSEEFEREVDRRLGREARLPPTSVEIVAEGTGYHLRMSVGAERRELRDADCSELFRAAVVVAVAVTLSESAARPSPRARGEATATADVPESSSNADRRRTGPSDLELSAALGAGLMVGLLPKLAPAFELQGSALFAQRFGFALAARYIARTAQEADADGRAVSANAVGGLLSGLYRPNGYWETALGGSVYRLSGTGSGPGNRSDTAWAAGPHAGLRFLPLQGSRIWLGLGGELQWNALRPRFEFLNHGQIFVASRFDFSLFLQVGPRFP